MSDAADDEIQSAADDENANDAVVTPPADTPPAAPSEADDEAVCFSSLLHLKYQQLQALKARVQEMEEETAKLQEITKQQEEIAGKPG